MPRNPRLDHTLVEQGLADTRSRAKALILAGDVLINGQRETRSGHPVALTDTVTLRQRPRFVSRGGEKLDHALTAFGIDVSSLVAADFGASTGGFTDCLLQRGASRVYAIDVGYGQIEERLRLDDRVKVMERTNVRYVETLPELVDIVVIDVSFISLSLMFPVVNRVLKVDGHCVPLIKPQFEAGRADVGKGGVVRDSAIHRKVLETTVRSAEEHGLFLSGLVASPLRGPAGNVEFLAHLRTEGPDLDTTSAIDRTLREAAGMVAAE